MASNKVGNPTTPSGNPSRTQGANPSSNNSIKGTNTKNSPSNFKNNNAAPNASVTSNSGSNKTSSAPPGKGVPAVIHTSDKPISRNHANTNQHHHGQPQTRTASNNNNNFRSNTSSTSVKSTGSSKSGNKSGSGNNNNKNANNHSNNQNKNYDNKVANRSVASTGNTVTTTQLQLNPPNKQQAAVKLPLPQPVSQQRHLSNLFRSAIHLELSRNFRSYVERALQQHKIFSGNGVYGAIRSALKNRGWVEKPGPLVYSHSARAANEPIQTKGFDNETDTAWMGRVLKDYPANFIWVNRRDNINWKYLTKDQMINRFPTAWFTTKTGLCACLQHVHWFSEAGVSDTFFPRCYRLSLEEERQAFQEDFRLTACMSFLRHFVLTFQRKGPAALADIHSKITPLSIDFACRQLGTYMRTRRHEDIDWLLTPNFMTQHWDAFVQQYYAVVHEQKKIRFDGAESVQTKYEIAKKTLRKVAQFWPQSLLDGELNMWICKPAARSCGSGIVIRNNLEQIMTLITQNNLRESNWVVQKYIERPLLIYRTKFDIRQWFLLTDWTPLTVWFYRESYVRFCTKPFALDNFHESIHLCNNAIQCRYQNAPNRDRNLPDDNMWSSDKFQGYLKSINRAEAWPAIYAGMKQAIVGVLLASQETIDTKKRVFSCHELFGADFMLSEDFKPWLIEINDRPAMDPSTRVTARLCAQVLEDVVKVVVDRKNNRKADTGGFELIYRQNAASTPGHEFSGHELTVVGKRLTRDLDWPMTMSPTHRPTPTSQPAVSSATSRNPSNVKFTPSTPTKQSLSEHIEKLRVQNQEMYQSLKNQQKIT